MRRLGQFIEIIVGAVFLWSGIAKLLDPSAFLSAILTYEVFSYKVSVIASLGVPYLELCVGACLVFRVIIVGARLLAVVLLVLFIILLSQAAMRGLDVDCGCFGSSTKSSESGFFWPIARDVIMLIGIGLGIVAGVNANGSREK
tara:strand:+ start:1351 stop:1782 length:432 start_codon:yes stop_codon:yes gene_type:complete